MSAIQLQRAITLYQKGQADKAAAVCRKVLRRQPGQPDALHVLGSIARDRQQSQQALRYFQQGLRAAPGHVHLLNSIGLLFKHMGQMQDAKDCFERSIKIDPTYFQGRYNLANVCGAEGDTDRARKLYRQVIKQRGDFVDALANLSRILEQDHELDEARSLAEKAANLSPQNFFARLTLANLAKREHRYDEVLHHLHPLLESGSLSPVNYAVAAGLCAQANEKQEDYSQAIHQFENANDTLFQLHADAMVGPRSIYSPESLKTLLDFFAVTKPAERPTEDTNPKTPAFLVGFPRSGTTLLDQILSSHSRITVLEEKENFEAFYTQFPATPDDLERLMACGSEQLQPWRDSYWQQITDEIEFADDLRIVDKLPLNIILLGHIRTLFPAARIIFALRDPRDVVFSCFQQRFGMNQAMFQFLKLETAVSYYDQVMSLAKIFKDDLSIPMHFVRYESVISDYDAEVNAVLEYLGLDWEDGVRDYQSTARKRRISTPSAPDVIRSLYTTSIGKWRHYSEFIGDRFAPLQKWVDYWGYE